jgi:hypothetical protein
MSRRKSRRQRSIPQQKALSNAVVPDLTPNDARFPQPLIFFALAEEYGGLDSLQGTDWDQPSTPPAAPAPVLGTA